MSSSLKAASLFNVNGLVAVVTGGGTGIGLMIAKALALNGADKVYIIGRRPEPLSLAAKISPNIIPLVGDVTSQSSLQGCIDKIQKETGYINVLFANSGISGPNLSGYSALKNPTISDVRKVFWRVPMEEFSRTYEVNNTAAFYSVVAFLELLDAGNKKGNVTQKSQVIGTGSAGAFNRSPLGGFAYGTSKAGLTHMMKSLSTFLVEWNIRANILAPGLYPSEMSNPLMPNGAVPTSENSFPKSYIPATRGGTEEDMAGAVLYLSSHAGGFLNGNVLLTDGGRLAVMPGTY